MIDQSIGNFALIGNHPQRWKRTQNIHVRISVKTKRDILRLVNIQLQGCSHHPPNNHIWIDNHSIRVAASTGTASASWSR